MRSLGYSDADIASLFSGGVVFDQYRERATA
jgi:hypothetical protein